MILFQRFVLTDLIGFRLGLLLVMLLVYVVPQPAVAQTASAMPASTPPPVDSHLTWQIKVDFVRGKPLVYWDLVRVNDYGGGVYDASVEVSKNISASCTIAPGVWIVGNEATFDGVSGTIACLTLDFEKEVALYNKQNKTEFDPTCKYSKPGAPWAAADFTLSHEIGRHPLVSMPGMSFAIVQKTSAAYTDFRLKDDPINQQSKRFAIGASRIVAFSGYNARQVEQTLEYSGRDSFMDIASWHIDARKSIPNRFFAWGTAMRPKTGIPPAAAYDSAFLNPLLFHIGFDPVTGDYAKLTLRHLRTDPPCKGQ